MPRLKHDKRVYRLWFEFLKRAYEADDVTVDTDFYAVWEDVADVRFTEWWDAHWIDLFAERDTSPRVLGPGEAAPPNDDDTVLYLEIPINKPITTVLAEIKELIQPSFEEVKVGRKRAYPSTAKFQITQGAEIRVEVIRMMLRCYHLKQQGVRTRDIPEGVIRRILDLQERQKAGGRQLASKGVFASDAWENTNRYVQRYVKQAKAIIRNVASGEFPGRY